MRRYYFKGAMVALYPSGDRGHGTVIDLSDVRIDVHLPSFMGAFYLDREPPGGRVVIEGNMVGSPRWVRHEAREEWEASG